MTQSENQSAGTLEDLLWVVPRFWDRTARQIELSRALLAHVPCVGSLLGATLGAPAKRPTEPTEDIDVLDVLDDEPTVATTAGSTGTGAVNGRPAASPGAHQAPLPGRATPSEAELAVPQYDSLAASQVIPRLEMLSVADLEQILIYEENHRNRQTIIHKVRQLLATSSD